MFRKKIPVGRIIPPFLCKSSESGRFFIYLHDSNSIFRARRIKSEIFSGCTVSGRVGSGTAVGHSDVTHGIHFRFGLRLVVQPVGQTLHVRWQSYSITPDIGRRTNNGAQEPSSGSGHGGRKRTSKGPERGRLAAIAQTGSKFGRYVLDAAGNHLCSACCWQENGC